MARGVNKVILLGNLGNDPESKALGNGGSVVTLSVATSEQWKDKNTGQMQERTEWHRIILFNRLADIAAQYLKKGSKVYLEGSLRTRQWQDKDGQTKYTTEIVAAEMQMLDGRSDSQAPANTGGYANQQRQAPAQGSGGGYGPASSDFDDDIPFSPLSGKVY